ncbi:MAG: FprA family A-type flavoprotein [Methanobacteriaceae archaeon]|jgi:flavorubredoxin|nr:FprA family A-type flavoprotein [Methanobacteriaceae archaeon]
MKARAEKIGDGVYWIGILDWNIRTYHGYTLDGTTYNAYLVFSDDKVALIDNAYPGNTKEMMARIDDAFAQEGKDSIEIDYIIQNHVELDHSGVLIDLHKRFPNAPIYCSKIAKKGLLKHFPSLKDCEYVIVGTGDSLSVGKKTLAFLDAFLLHWPDSMFTLLVDDGILFPNDAFGQHLCYSKRYDTDIPEYVLMDASKKFYANLITPLSKLVLKKLNEIKELGLLDQIKMIAPSHGQIWTNPMKIIEAYNDWATGKCEDKITIIYDTMHYSTQKMAKEIAEGAMNEGYDVEMFYLHEDERSEIVKSILTSKGVAIGAPTINDQPYPSIADIIYYLKGLRFDKTGIERTCVTFGSMGGQGGSPEKLAKELSESGFNVINSQEIIFVPTEDEELDSFKLGEELVKEAKKL